MVHRTTACEAARHVADELTWAGAGILPDLKYTKLLLNFGANYHRGRASVALARLAGGDEPRERA